METPLDRMRRQCPNKHWSPINPWVIFESWSMSSLCFWCTRSGRNTGLSPVQFRDVKLLATRWTPWCPFAVGSLTRIPGGNEKEETLENPADLCRSTPLANVRLCLRLSTNMSVIMHHRSRGRNEAPWNARGPCRRITDDLAGVACLNA